MGKLASQVNSIEEIKAIFSAYRGNGGTMSYEQLERHFKLKETNGMTAYRIIQRARKLAQPSQEFEVRKVPSEQKVEPEPVDDDKFDAIDFMMSSREWRTHERASG